METAIAPKWHDASSTESDRFIRENGLATYIATAKELATRFFHVESGECEFVQAGDSNEQWILVRIRVKGTNEDLHAAKDEYTSHWVASVPPPQRHMISLSLDII